MPVADKNGTDMIAKIVPIHPSFGITLVPSQLITRDAAEAMRPRKDVSSVAG
jgi:hypothetical protein